MGWIKDPDYIQVSGNEITIENSSTHDYAHLFYYDNGTLEKGEFFNSSANERFNYTRIYYSNPIDEIKWSVEPGDTLYFGLEGSHIKLDITAIVNSSGEGRGIVQKVLANYSEWDSAAKSWTSSQKENLTIGCANETKPIMDPGTDYPPFIFPLGTNGTDLHDYLEYEYGGSDVTISYGEYWGKALNKTSGEEIYVETDLKGYFRYHKSTEENVTFYYMNSTVIPSSLDFEIDPYIIKDFEIKTNITVSNARLLYAGLDYNPIDVPIDKEKVFLDVWINDSTNLDSLNFTVEYDPNKYVGFKFWWFNESADEGAGAWEEQSYQIISSGKNFISLNHTSFYAISATAYEPKPPGSFNLSTNADSPDTDGSFSLNWTISANADSYTIYTYSSNITEVNSSLTIIADGLTNKSYVISDLNNGTYYYAVLAKNNDGQELSNSVKVDVSLSSDNGDDGTGDSDDDGGNDGDQLPSIPFGSIFLIFMAIGIVGLVFKRKRNL
jgi:hypothetical protein